MRKLSALIAFVLFFSFSGIMNAQTQEVKKESKGEKKTEQVVKKVKKSSKKCDACPEKSKCSAEKKAEEKDKK